MHGRAAIGDEVRDAEVDPARRTAWNRAGTLRDWGHIGHWNRGAAVEVAEAGVGGPEWMELGDD